MKVFELILNAEPTTITVGATDWDDAKQKLAATHDWFARLVDETDTDPRAVHVRRNTKISFQEVK